MLREKQDKNMEILPGPDGVSVIDGELSVPRRFTVLLFERSFTDVHLAQLVILTLYKRKSY